jgi:UDP-glucose 4-epimerase
VNILIVGGAGYIGSCASRYLAGKGHEVWVYDDLSTGHAGAALPGRLIQGSLHEREKLVEVFAEKKIDAVMHFAANALVGESVENPAKYYQNNVVGTIDLLEAMRAADVRKIVFSSTTATYGTPDVVPITEDESQQPINPYGFTKLVVEHVLADYAAAYGLGYAALRYFNAAGAEADGLHGEHHDPESHLIPIVLEVALGQRDSITIFGDDYPTPDGTCIRDYIHIEDLASAHLLALDRLEHGQGLCLNLGTGQGYSVLEVIEACRKVSGHEIPATLGKRRAGDPAELVADATRAREQLAWEPQYNDIQSIVETAWRWHQAHPNGYRSE